MDMPPEKINIPESNKTDQGKPIRVLQVFASLDRGGAEAMIMSLYRAIDRSKIQFDFVVNASDCDYAYEEEIRALGGRIYRIPRYRVVNLFEYRKSWIKLLKAHPEWRVVHGHHTAPASVYIPIASRMGQTSIAHSHNSLVKENRLKLLMRKIALFPVRYQADHLFACSKLAGEWMFGPSSSFRIVNNAIKISDFVYDQRVREEKRAEFNIGDSFLIGHVGSFSEQKNHAFLLEVFRDIYKRDADAKLLLVGDGPLRLEIESLAEKYDVKDRVIFSGVRSDIPAVLSAMDLFLFPSLHEGFPVTLVEAQANGLPIVASDAISNEVKITDLIEFISLGNQTEYWADRVLKCDNTREQGNFSAKIRSAGYDIEQNVAMIEEFYLSAVN